MAHALGTCPACGAGVATPEQTRTATCPNPDCGVAVAVKRVVGTYGDHVHCDDSCIYARRPVCTCQCGGENHGAGYVDWTWTPEYVRAKNAKAHAAKTERREKKEAAARQSAADATAALIAEHPSLQWLLDVSPLGLSAFLDDMRALLIHDRPMTPRQVEATVRAIESTQQRQQEAQERESAQAALVSAGVEAPEGTVEVTGVIVHVRRDDGQWGANHKMIVETEAGWKVWATVPRVVLDAKPTTVAVPAADWLRGRSVRFTATLTRSDRDPLFAFAKRPTRVQLLAPVAV